MGIHVDVCHLLSVYESSYFLFVVQAFYPFESAEEALSNINAISEHIVSPELATFLELHLPDVKKSKKTTGFSLGVIDPMFASAVQESTSFPCKSDDTVREILRGVRLHLPHFIKEVGYSSFIFLLSIPN
jgi:nucleolar protein 56